MNTPPWLLIAASLLVVHVGVAENPFPQTRLALRDGRRFKEQNQTFPFRFEGAADDPVFYAELRAQTTPRASEAKPSPQSTSGSGLAPRAGEVPTAVSANPLVPAWFSQAPPLPPPRGEAVRVATVAELLAATERVEAGGTILLADGHYQLPRAIALEGKRNIALRSASGDPARVTLSGRGCPRRPGLARAGQQGPGDPED